MLSYFCRRVLYTAPVLVGVGLVCFLLIYLAPGDPISASVSADTPKEVVDQLRREYGLDRPLPLQFLSWLGRVAQGDLGVSIATGRPVLGEIRSAIGNTFLLAVAASAIGFPLGVGLGFLGGWRRDSWVDRAASIAGVVGVSVPHYWLGIVLVAIFSVEMNLLPAMGAGPAGEWSWDWLHLRHLLLPAVTMSVIPTGITMRTVRATVGDVLEREFIEALHAKGTPGWAIMLHVVKNAAPTTLAVVGLQFGYLLGGSILVEKVFAWPGAGLLMNNAIFQRDLPLLQGSIVVLAVFFVALNLAVDLLQTVVDPRIARS